MSWIDGGPSFVIESWEIRLSIAFPAVEESVSAIAIVIAVLGVARAFTAQCVVSDSHTLFGVC